LLLVFLKLVARFFKTCCSLKLVARFLKLVARFLKLVARFLKLGAR
jgi:hypothetical protein